MAQSVTLVAGPPCAGKSTYVQRHASPDAYVVCWDSIAASHGLPIHPTPLEMRHQLRAEYNARLAHVSSADEAWVIRSLPDPIERVAWATALDAELVTLVPPLDLLTDRALRRPDPAATIHAIHTWLAMQP
jgi:hypothetical protein